MNLGHETEHVEFKKSTSELKEGCSSIAAMLNKHGSGVLYFGVTSKGDVCGQDVSESTLRKVSQAITNHIEPTIRPIIEALDDGEGHAYLKVTFEGRDAPYQCDGRFRIRQADEDLLMSSADIVRFAGEVYGRSNPWDARPSGRAPEAIVPGLVERYVKLGNECGRIAEPWAGDADALSRLGLIAEDGSLTNAAAELFCPSAYAARLKMGVLGSHDRVDIIDLRHEDGPLLDLLERAEFYIVSNIRRRFIFDGSMQRREVPEIPREAIREALVNAFCHRDYSGAGDCVVVDVFADAVEITNPGFFPFGISPDEWLAGSAPPARSRNPLIAGALFRAGYIEAYGSGIRRIKVSCDTAGVDFEYRQERGCTTLVFYRPEVQASEKGKLSSPGALSETASRALLVLRGRSGLSAEEVAYELGVSKRQAQRVLKELLDASLVEKKRTGNRVKWRSLEG